ncbi:hypothetical protein V6N12_050975 [Hibiscus sabdariffa]|uniref:Uncharacterized protein n=1 Tax=Hibiscus sabdariffa TaxID=183260 RepID=A0ABR2GDY1_9ROSI
MRRKHQWAETECNVGGALLQTLSLDALQPYFFPNSTPPKLLFALPPVLHWNSSQSSTPATVDGKPSHNRRQAQSPPLASPAPVAGKCSP